MDYPQYDDIDDEYLEIPSCIESLVSSAQQLQQLANQIDLYYNRLLLCYAYIVEQNDSSEVASPVEDHSTSKPSPAYQVRANGVNKSTYNDQNQASIQINKLIGDKKALKSLNSIVEFLPHLEDLNLFIEKCFITIEASLKRAIYYLNKSGTTITNGRQNSSSIRNEFQLSNETRLDSLLVGLMNIIYALISLDKTLTVHTNINRDLTLLATVCRHIIEQQLNYNLGINVDVDSELISLPREKLEKLVEFLANLQLTLANDNGDTLFKQCLKYFEHFKVVMSATKSQKGFNDLCLRFEDFLISFGETQVESQLPDVTSGGGHVNVKSGRLNSMNLICSNVLLSTSASIYLHSATQRAFGLVCLFIFYSVIFNKKSNEKKLIKTINSVLSRTPNLSSIVHLAGSANCYILFNEFVAKHLPQNVTSLDLRPLELIESAQMDLLLKLDASKEYERLSMKTIPWLVRLRAELDDKQTSAGQQQQQQQPVDIWPKRQLQLVEQGLNLARDIQSSIKNILTAHLHHSKPMNKLNLVQVYKLVGLLKSIQFELRQNEHQLESNLLKCNYLLRVKWRKLFYSIQKRLVSAKFSERKLNMETILILTSICSKAELNSTPFGCSLVATCLPMLLASLNLEEINQLNQLLDLMTLNYQFDCSHLFDCAFLYWNMGTFSVYYNHVFEECPGSVDELKYFHGALDDMFVNVFSLPEVDGRKAEAIKLNCLNYLKKLNKELMEQFKVDYLDRLCQEFEMELRLQTHRDLYLIEGQNPFNRRHVYNFKQIFASAKRQSSFKIFEQRIDLMHYVEQHLNRICYNLTSLAPHDWSAHDNMMNLARQKYNLTFVNTQLPVQTLESGLDLLEITRNLALFSARYGYDLINQLFIEKCTNSDRFSTGSLFGANSMLSGYAQSSSGQSLNVVQIQHVSRSIQTHGYGILNSAVNCTYRTLKKLINVFSRQLSSEKLRAHLQKELQHQQNTTTTTTAATKKATLERAQKMAKRFRLSTGSLESSPSNERAIDLDSLRQTITQIGNLLAFIRLLKSGALNCASRSVDCLPDCSHNQEANFRLFLETNKDLTVHVEGHLTGPIKSEQTLEKAAQNLDQCLSHIQENFSPNTNYFNMIVRLFCGLIQADKNSVDAKQSGEDNDGNKLDHMRLFFLAIPGLTINYIDHLISCKHRISSKSSAARFGGLVTDDGFSMGLAFLLTILEQTSKFAGLEWLQLMRTKLLEDKAEIEGRLDDHNYDESLKQTSSITLRRLNLLYSEYCALDYTLNGALLLFRSSGVV